MTYVGDKTWAQMASDATAAAVDLSDSLHHAREAYERFIRFRNGRTDADIATALSVGGVTVTPAMVADLAACFQTFLEQDNFAGNAPNPAQGDRYFSMRKFS